MVVREADVLNPVARGGFATCTWTSGVFGAFWDGVGEGI